MDWGMRSMLFDVLFLMAGAVAGVGMIACYRQGVKDGRAIGKDQPLEPVLQSNAKREQRSDDAYYDAIMDNLEHYDGSEIGQVDVPSRKGAEV